MPRAKGAPQAGGPVYRLPPYEVQMVYTARSETTDWGLQLLGIPALWGSTRGQGVKVAVLDTGCDLGHFDLKDAILATKDFANSRARAQDVQGHGTHCAGVIGARRNDAGVVGVAPECGLLVAKVLGDNGSGSLEAIAKGADWAVAQGADVLSLSLGGSQGSPALEAALRRAADAGTIVVCAAGNEGPDENTVGYPARYPFVVAVGAIDRRQRLARFSSRGPRVDVVAPGVDVLSCYPVNSFAKLSGTSMATPFVAGVAALWVAGDAGERSTRPARFREALRATAKDLGDAGFDPLYGYGLVTPEALVRAVNAPRPAVTLDPEDLTASGKAKLRASFGVDLTAGPASVTLCSGG